MNNPVALFFKELILRFGAKSPKFFQVLKIVTGLLTFAGLVPTFLQKYFNVQLADNFVELLKIIGTHAGIFFIATWLPADSQPVAQTRSGELLKVTDEKKLPFTAQAEQKAEDKKPDALPEVINNPNQ